MVWIPGGTTLLGSDHHYPEEAPAHLVTVDGFFLDEHPVTNFDFAEFVSETGYVTFAERAPDPADYPDADPALMVPSSAVFNPPAHQVQLDDANQWWSQIPGADWKHPDGPDGDLTCLGDHPVTHVVWEDALAYAAWAGKVLPTEAEWEYAARGGLTGKTFAWGDEMVPSGVHMANVWQGDFPSVNTIDDGYYWTSPVGNFAPNGYGLYDMIGNVWEWTTDWWSSHRPDATPACCAPTPRVNPTGGRELLSVDTAQPMAQRRPRKVIKGGSFLCAPNYCQRYRPAARLAQPIDTSTCHVGFRCAIRP